MAIMEWFKVNGFNLIYGSLRLDPPIHQLAFIKLLALASVSRVPGTVCIADKVPYPMDVLATTLGIPQDELKKAIDFNVLPEQDRLKINEWGGIEITKWAEYQSKSYLRVRKHREKKRIEENRIEERACNASVTSCNNDVTLKLSELLYSQILIRKPDYKKPNLENWAANIDLMIRVDKRVPETIEKVIYWCQKDSFWQNNILSTEKLRKQFDKLELKMNSETPKKPIPAKPKCFCGKDGTYVTIGNRSYCSKEHKIEKEGY